MTFYLRLGNIYEANIFGDFFALANLHTLHENLTMDPLTRTLETECKENPTDLPDQNSAFVQVSMRRKAGGGVFSPF